MATFASGVAEVTRNRAEDFVKSWVKASDERLEGAQTLVKDLVEWSEANRRELTSFVRSEIQDQLASMGIGTRRDLEKLERRIERVEESLRSAAASSARKSVTPVRKATARKTRKKSSGRKKKTTTRTGSGRG